MSYRYWGNCTQSTAEDIQQLRRLSKRIRWQTFKKHIPEARSFFEEQGAFLPETTDYRIEKSDWISFFDGRFRGEPCYYAVWSGYEWIWVPK